MSPILIGRIVLYLGARLSLVYFTLLMASALLHIMLAPDQPELFLNISTQLASRVYHSGELARRIMDALWPLTKGDFSWLYVNPQAMLSLIFSIVALALVPRWPRASRPTPIYVQPPSTIYNLHGNARINLNSIDNSANYALSIHHVLDQMTDRINSAKLSEGSRRLVVHALDDLRATAGKSTFREKYASYAGLIADHITIFGGLISILEALVH